MSDESICLTKMIDTHKPTLMRYALSLTGDEDDANDLMQETLLCAWRFFDSFEIGTNEFGWLKSIMKNQFINSKRKGKFFTDSVSYEDVRTSQHPFGSMEMQGMVYDLTDETIKALLSLDKSHRVVFIMSVAMDYSYEEIASVLDIPLGTVSSRVAKAKSKLKSLLTNHGK